MEFIAKNYKTVDTEDLTRELHRYIQDHDIIAYDVEATGINPRQDVIIGFSVSAKPGDGYYLPTKVYNPETDKLDKLYIDNAEADVVARFLIQELVGKKLVMHNGVYDCEITKNYYGVSLIESLWVENMLLIHTVAEEGAFGFGAAFSLKSIAKWKQEEFKLDAEKDANEEQLALKESIKKNGGKTLRSNMEMYKADLDVLCTYGASDADLTIRSLYHFLPILKEEGLESLFFEEEVMPVYRNLTYVMETQGVKLDIPLLTRLREDIQKDITTYGEKVLSEIMKLPEAQNWVLATANEKFPYKIYDPEKQVYVIKNRGKHAQSAINRFFHLLGGECPLPKNPKKPDEWHATKGNVSKCLTDEHAALRSFLLDGDMSALEELEKSFFLKCSLELWKSSNGDVYVNIASKKQLGEIVFDYLREEPLKHTDKGAPQFNEEFISSIKDKYTWSSDLYIFNRLNKVSSYYERLWDKKEGDRMYFNFKQHGTVSGRYGSDAQQMPRPMEEGDDPEVVIKYSNEVRALMIPDEGYVFLDADYESLEPHCFAAVANDEGLKNIFRNKHDFYSTIAIATEGLQGVSADKKADNFLKKIDPNKRQSAKAYCLDGDSMVLVDGRYIKIKDVKLGDLIRSKEGYNKVLNTFKRESETCLVNTNRGSIRCTLDHKFYIDGNWIEAQDLKKGMFVDYYSPKNIYIEDKLPIMSNMSYRNGGDKPLGYLSLDTDWAYFAGMLLGDGLISINQNLNSKGHGLKGYVGVCGLYKDGFIDWFDSFMLRLGYKTRVHQIKDSKTSDDSVVTKVVANSEMAKLVYDTLDLGLWSDDVSYKCKNLRVPTYILNSSEDIKSSFLAGLLDTDGYIKDNNGSPAINICSKDYRLITGIIQLLNTLGLQGSMRLDYNKTYNRNYYSLSLTRDSCRGLYDLGVSRYMKCDRKKSALESYKDYTRLNKSRLKPAQILAVEFDNLKVDVYDITVENEHCFYANGMLVHNCLGVPYGMRAYALSKLIDKTPKESQVLIDNYLNAYPELKKWMESTNKFVKENGYVKNMLGRIRHLGKVKAIANAFGGAVDKLYESGFRKELERTYGHEKVVEVYRDFKNGMNNAKNWQIQSLAASVVNRAGLGVVREANKNNLIITPVAQIHDQWIFMTKQEYKEEAAQLVQRVMETETDIGIDLKAPPEIAMNWRDGH